MKMSINASKKFLISFGIAVCGLPLVVHSQYNIDWAKRIGGSGSSTSVNRMVADEYGNIYVTGVFSGTVDFNLSDDTSNLVSVGGSNVFLAKYGAEGQLHWAKRMGNSSSSPYNIAVKGNEVYLVGIFAGTANFNPLGSGSNLVSNGGNDCFFAKYDSLGEYHWAHGIGGAKYDQLIEVYIDKNDDVFLVGDFAESVDFDPSAGVALITANSTYNVFFGKYNSSGEYQWVKTIKGTDLSHGYAIADDSAGNIYVAGAFRGSSDFNPSDEDSFVLNSVSGSKDMFLSKYDSSGNFVWASQFGGTGLDQATSLQTDEQGNIYMLGLFQSTVDFDPSDSVRSHTSKGGYDISLAKYSTDGNYIWSKALGGTGYDYAPMVVLSTGKLYLSGVFSNTVNFNVADSSAGLSSSGQQDVFVAVYDADGQYMDAFKMGGTGNEGTPFLALNNNDVYVSGSFVATVNFGSNEQLIALNPAGSSDVFIAKYADSSLTTNLYNGSTIDRMVREEGFMAYPNPTSGLLRVRVPLGSTVELLDMHGNVRAVRTLSSGGELSFDLSSYSGGVYLLRNVSTGSVIRVVKMD